MALFLVDCGGSSFTSSSGASGGAGALGGSGAGATGGSAQAGTESELGGSAGQSGQGGSNSGGHGGKAQGGDAQGGSSAAGGSLSSAGTGGNTAGTGGSTITGGSGGSPVITSCPTDPPNDMDACEDGLVCTYGDDIRLACRTRYTCTSGAFAIAVSSCKALSSCSERAGGVPIMGSACTAAGEECLLAQPPNYIYCRCDASWLCSPTPAETMPTCPQVAPNVGQSCDSSGLSCAYGSCSFPPAYDPTLQCKGKAWQQAITECATPGGG